MANTYIFRLILVCVYIDDVIVYSSNGDEHCDHLIKITITLQQSHMKISFEKSKFFKSNVKLLGYHIAYNVIKTDEKNSRQ